MFPSKFVAPSQQVLKTAQPLLAGRCHPICGLLYFPHLVWYIPGSRGNFVIYTSSFICEILMIVVFYRKEMRSLVAKPGIAIGRRDPTWSSGLLWKEAHEMTRISHIRLHCGRTWNKLRAFILVYQYWIVLY